MVRLQLTLRWTERKRSTPGLIATRIGFGPGHGVMCAHHERRAATTRDGDEGSMVLGGNRAPGKVAPRAVFAQKAPAEEFPNLGLCHALRMQ